MLNEVKHPGQERPIGPNAGETLVLTPRFLNRATVDCFAPLAMTYCARICHCEKSRRAGKSTVTRP
jgi:hypothetical protein